MTARCSTGCGHGHYFLSGDTSEEGRDVERGEHVPIFKVDLSSLVDKVLGIVDMFQTILMTE